MTAALLRLAEQGPVRGEDLDRHGIPRTYLRRLCDRGLLEPMDRGIYRLKRRRADDLSALVAVAQHVPQGIICLRSALQVHGMGAVPGEVWVLLDRSVAPPKLAYPKLELVRASGAARKHGVETRTIEGVKVQITTPAKTVADCFRYPRKLGEDLAQKALEDYVRNRRGSIDALTAAAEACEVEDVITPLLDALVAP